MIEVLAILTLLSAPTEQWPVLWPIVPPVIQSSGNVFKELRTANLKKEYPAPIPDSLAGYDVHELSDADGNVVRIVLEKPVADEELTRLDGPTHSWPHMGCLMCLGNHLIGTHGQSANYLHSITYEQWHVLHDNLHNDSSFDGVEGSGEGWIGYEAGGGYASRRGLLERLFRRRGR